MLFTLQYRKTLLEVETALLLTGTNSAEQMDSGDMQLHFRSVVARRSYRTLHAHQDRPPPQWPQLVNINAIVSLFSMLI
jgi:hypothetical protein